MNSIRTISFSIFVCCALLLTVTAAASSPLFTDQSQSATKSEAEYPNGCPDGFPLDCGNDHCCPAGHVLYCGSLEPSPCIDLTGMNDNELYNLNQRCSPAFYCHQ